MNRKRSAGRMAAIMLILVMVIGSFSVSVFADDGTGSAETSVSEDSSAVEAAPVSGDTGSSGGDVVVNEEAGPAREAAAGEQGDNGQQEDSGQPSDNQPSDSQPAEGDGEPEPPKYQLEIDLTGDDIPDDFSITVQSTSNGQVGETTFSKGETGLLELCEGAGLTVKSVTGLGSEYQEGSSPKNYKKQLKLVLADTGDEGTGSELFRISLNNSDIMDGTHEGSTNITGEFIMPARAVLATVKTAFRVDARMDSAGDPGSFAVNNETDSDSEYSDFFPLPGDTVSLNFISENYKSITVTGTDGEGNEIEFNGFTFKMPDSVATVRVKFERNYTPRNITIKNVRPAWGSISTEKNQYTVRQKVVVNAKANKGYKILMLNCLYTESNGERVGMKIEKDSNGDYSFIMPDYDVIVYGNFKEDDSDQSSGGSSSAAQVSTVNSEPEPEQEPAAAEPGSEVSVLDVTPAIARAVAEVTLSLTTLALVI